MLAAEQAAHVRSAGGRLGRVLAAEQVRGRVRADVDLTTAASALLVVVHGVGTQATFDPSHWTPARQRAALAEQLALVEPARLPSTTRPQHDADATAG